ncbi:MAG: hypothetical protein V7K25_10765 [Nostoc sp.]|uniref:hypothetical protein n=1 Tax=Nostoc sp. TaxID=1180 RepID=UPI002FFAC5E6
MVKNFIGKRPIIIAHRGASGYRSEHTLAAYELAPSAAGCAYALGANYIDNPPLYNATVSVYTQFF